MKRRLDLVDALVVAIVVVSVAYLLFWYGSAADPLAVKSIVRPGR